jgi:hypothetical protein
MCTTLVPLALTLTLLLQLPLWSTALATPPDWNAMLFGPETPPARAGRNGAVTPPRGTRGASLLPADPVAAAATCAAVYGEVHVYHDVFGPPEASRLFGVRSRAARKALGALVADTEAVRQHIEAADERLAFLPEGAWRHIKRFFRAYDEACTALLAPKHSRPPRPGHP